MFFAIRQIRDLIFTLLLEIEPLVIYFEGGKVLFACSMVIFGQLTIQDHTVHAVYSNKGFTTQ